MVVTVPFPFLILPAGLLLRVLNTHRS
jgi:hypothetical protein